MASKSFFKIFNKRFLLRFLTFKVKKKTNTKKIKRKYMSRSCLITQMLIGSKLFIHKGNVFKRIKINKYQINYRLGEFSFTRKPFIYPSRLKKKKKSLNRR